MMSKDCTYTVVVPNELYQRIYKEVSPEIVGELDILPAAPALLYDFVKSQENRVDLITFIIEKGIEKKATLEYKKEWDNDSNQVPTE